MYLSQNRRIFAPCRNGKDICHILTLGGQNKSWVPLSLIVKHMFLNDLLYLSCSIFSFSPPDPAKLRKARTKRLKEINMNAALKEIFAFFFFLICLMDVAQYHRDPNTSLLSKTLSETFVDVDAFSIPLYSVSKLLSMLSHYRSSHHVPSRHLHIHYIDHITLNTKKRGWSIFYGV